MARAKKTMPHDGSYRRLFTHPQMIEALLRRYVAQSWVERLDFETLEQVPAHYVSEEHQQRESDLLWRVRLQPASDRHEDETRGKESERAEWFYVYLLLEFQSGPDRFMAVRLLSYLMLFYEWLIARRELSESKKLPPVLPIVLYNGRRRWRAPVQVANLIEPAFGGLDTYVPRFEYLVLDEGHLPREALEPLDNPVTAVFQLEQSQELEDLRRIVHQLTILIGGEELEEMRRDFAAWLRRVLLPTRFRGEKIPEARDLLEIDEMLAETVKTWPKQWMAQGLEEGLEKGLQKGLQKGRRQGQLEGSREILTSQIEAKFGSPSTTVRERIEAANQTQVARWARRILTATSIDELFRD